MSRVAYAVNVADEGHPVSYTHLDVYKRQEHVRAGGDRRLDRRDMGIRDEGEGRDDDGPVCREVGSRVHHIGAHVPLAQGPVDLDGEVGVVHVLSLIHI